VRKVRCGHELQPVGPLPYHPAKNGSPKRSRCTTSRLPRARPVLAHRDASAIERAITELDQANVYLVKATKAIRRLDDS
jgi:hypothetical protein